MDRVKRGPCILGGKISHPDRAFSKAFFTILQDLTRVKILSLAEGGRGRGGGRSLSKFRPPCFAGFFLPYLILKISKLRRSFGDEFEAISVSLAAIYDVVSYRMIDSLPVLFNSIVLSLS